MVSINRRVFQEIFPLRTYCSLGDFCKMSTPQTERERSSYVNGGGVPSGKGMGGLTMRKVIFYDQLGRTRLTSTGVWVNMPGDSKPSITLIGSSNYTRRSYSLDLEMNALVITQEDKLQSALSKEVGWLQQFSKKLELEDFKRADRQVGWKVRFLLWLFGSQL